MVDFKKTIKIQLRLVFLYLAIFPLGQLLRLDTPLFAIHPSDLIISISGILFLLTRNKKYPIETKYIVNFFVICIFSLIFSLTFFSLPDIFIGIFYLLRLICYFLFFFTIFNLSQKIIYKEFLLKSLVLAGSAIAIFGWIQYFIFPDQRALYHLGWDDHFMRLTSTFLDPAFTGILLVFTLIAIFALIKKYSASWRIKTYLFTIFLLTTIAFTYSRSSYLALIVALIYFFLKKFTKIYLIFTFIFLLILPFLPRTFGQGVLLERTNSIIQKADNLNSSLVLLNKSPVFGVGFNNICVAKKVFLDDKNLESHSCSGLDNSLIFIAVTTGIVGLIVFLHLVFQIVKNTSKDLYGFAFLTSGLGLLIHSMFTNTLFYPWVMGWAAILMGISRAKEYK